MTREELPVLPTAAVVPSHSGFDVVRTSAMRASTSPKGRPSARSTSAASAWPRIASRRSQSPEFDARTNGYGK